jgi:hypothetical protein
MARDRGPVPCSDTLHVEQPRALGQVQADELRVKTQDGIVWMALAMMVKTRLWLGGEVSEQPHIPLIRRLIERVRRCATHRPLLCCRANCKTRNQLTQSPFSASRRPCLSRRTYIVVRAAFSE